MGASRAHRYTYPRLSEEEKKAERIFLMMREGCQRGQYEHAMQQLEQQGREGAIATCYCTWLALRDVPVCPESWAHWVANRKRLANLLNEK